MSDLKVGFIHITKTGGTNIKDKNKNKELYFGDYHREDAFYYYKKKMPCFAIIRDPIKRYESMFYYNTFGSDKYEKSNNIKDINLFVDKHYNNRKFIRKFEDGIQFRKQVSWLNNNNSYIILFDKKNLVKNIEKFLLDEFSIDYKYNYEEKRINVTNINKKVELTQSSIDKIKKLYHEDVELYEKLLEYQQKNLKFYCKIKEL
tara:strand:+ start:35 stop:643 length:609 start_codon:yes stop_codon:yes gene_type:complete